MSMSWERVGPRIGRLWWKLAVIAEEKSIEAAQAGLPSKAVDFAMLAEAAFAQSTGDCDGFNIHEMVKDRAKAGQP